MRFKALCLAAIVFSLMAVSAIHAQRTIVASADSLVSAGLQRAKAEGKTLFLDFRASWCGPCLELQRFLSSETAGPIIENHFVVVPITLWERENNARLNNPGGEQLLKRFGGGDSIPFYVLVDASGQKILDDDGFPGGSFQIDDFIQKLAKGAPRLSAANRETLFEEAASMTRKRVWVAPPPAFRYGQISPTGRYLAFGHGDEGLGLHDFVAGLDRRLGKDVPQSAPVFSRDGRRVAYSARTSDGGLDVRIANVSGPASAPTVVASDRAATRLEPLGWIADGKALLVMSESAAGAGTRVITVTLEGGAIRERYAFPGSVERAVLSADGNQLAVEMSPRSGSAGSMLTMPVPAGEPTPAVANLDGGHVIGWSADSAYVLFYRARPAKLTFHVVDMRDGKKRAVTQVASEDGTTGQFTPIGLMDNGTLYYRLDSRTTSRPSIWILNNLFPDPAKK